MAPNYVGTFTGKRVSVLDPQVEDINILDIAHALSMSNRFNGHTKRPYTILQHSLATMHRLRDLEYSLTIQLVGLLHDAAEAYLGDIVSPVKQYLTEFQVIEDRMLRTILSKAGLMIPPGSILPVAVIQADSEMLISEIHHYMTEETLRNCFPAFLDTKPYHSAKYQFPANSVDTFLSEYYDLGGE